MPELIPELSVVTGASTGLGRELAQLCAQEAHRLILVADEPEVEQVAANLRDQAAEVETLVADLSSEDGITQLMNRIGADRIDNFLANAGIGLGDAFLDQDLADIRKVIALNVTGTTEVLHHIGRKMRQQGSGRILVTGSIAGFMPGSFQAVYNASKAYLDSLAYAIRNELKDSGVTVTCLMSGPTDTEFFNRAGMEDTPVGKDDDKDDPAMVARKGFDAMRKGQSGVVRGFINKVQATFSGLIPDTVLAQMHRRMAEPEER